MAGSPSLTSGNTSPFIAFVRDKASLDAAREFAANAKFGADAVREGDITDATSYLKANSSPSFLLVEVPSAEAAPELLDKLADVCAPTVKVIVTSKVNEFSFYSWLTEVGVFAYLLQPLTAGVIQKTLQKAEKPKEEKKEEKQGSCVIACMGTRGGVGTTTIASNLAYILAKEYGRKTALLDLDVQFGTAAMAFDLEPGRGVMALFEHPERVDSLFLDRVMVTYNDKLSLLGAEEPLKENINTKAQAAEVLLQRAKEKYPYIVIDLPRTLNPYTRAVLTQATHTVLVTEPTLLSLRDLLRLRDLIKDVMKKPDPIVVANREGLASKHEMNKADFEKHYGQNISLHIPCMMEAFAASANGELLIETSKNSAGLAALNQLAKMILGEDAEAEAKPAKPAKRFGGLLKGK